MQTELRAVRLGDEVGLSDLDRALLEDGRGMVLTIDQHESPQTQRERIAAARADEIVALWGERIVGHARLTILRPALCAHVGILGLGVHPEAQRHGVGRALMHRVIDLARARGVTRLELYVRADNDRGRALYRACGFTDECVRKRFVRKSDGDYVDDVIMVCFLE